MIVLLKIPIPKFIWGRHKQHAKYSNQPDRRASGLLEGALKSIFLRVMNEKSRRWDPPAFHAPLAK
jgi:hypothetical protein